MIYLSEKNYRTIYCANFNFKKIKNIYMCALFALCLKKHWRHMQESKKVANHESNGKKQTEKININVLFLYCSDVWTIWIFIQKLH